MTFETFPETKLCRTGRSKQLVKQCVVSNGAFETFLLLPVFRTGRSKHSARKTRFRTWSSQRFLNKNDEEEALETR